MESGPAMVPRLARYAGVVLNAMTALAWGGIAAIQFTGSLPLYGVVSIVLVVLYTRTAWGFLRLDPSAYARSFQVHVLGLVIDGAEIAFAHAWLYAPLAVIHGLAFVATYLSRSEFHGPRVPRR